MNDSPRAKKRRTDISESTSALCPFYRGEISRSVICEGVADRSSLRLTFVRSSDLKGHLYKFCYNGYSRCRVCRMLYGKYEDPIQKEKRSML